MSNPYIAVTDKSAEQFRARAAREQREFAASIDDGLNSVSQFGRYVKSNALFIVAGGVSGLLLSILAMAQGWL